MGTSDEAGASSEMPRFDGSYLSEITAKEGLFRRKFHRLQLQFFEDGTCRQQALELATDKLPRTADPMANDKHPMATRWVRENGEIAYSTAEGKSAGVGQFDSAGNLVSEAGLQYRFIPFSISADEF